MIAITEKAIDTNEVLRSVGSGQAGASVLFVGCTRQFTLGKETVELNYECYHEMAVKKLTELRSLAEKQWPIVRCSIVHRIGRVPIGEASVAVAVSTPHRAASFEAAEWLIDTLKKEVPVWKQESFADGQNEWIHFDQAANSVEPTNESVTGSPVPHRKRDS